MPLYETHLPVSNLAHSITFYQDVVGLELAFEHSERSVAFLYIDDRKTGMIGLWAPGSPFGWKEGEAHRSHFALSVSLPELWTHIKRLQGLGLTTTGFHGEVTDEPSVIGWMPAAQIYFRDPDGHSLEYITILDDPPDPVFFGTWTEWRQRIDQA